MSVSFLALSVTRTPEGGLEVALRYSYEGRPPPLRKRAEMAKAALTEILDRLEKDKPVDLGFAEDAARRVRTNKMEV